MDLNTLWFVLIAALLCWFFVLEGFDYGVGILLPFLGDTDLERRRIIDATGPVWDGHEVWIIAAVGAMFAAFPHWYATLFSGFYLGLFTVLAAMLVRVVAFEFRRKDRHRRWGAAWDWAIFSSSLSLAVIWGVAMGNLLAGVPIDAHKRFVGGVLDLFSPYTVVCGLASLGAFVTHGAIFLHLKSTDPIRQRAMSVVKSIGPITTLMILLFVVATHYWTSAFSRLGGSPGLVPITAFGAMLGAGAFVQRARTGWAFLMTSIAMAAATATIFLSLYPRVMVSSLNPDWSLTIYSAAASPHTLKTMGIVAAVVVPIVFAYQGWTHWVFRHRAGHTTQLED